MRFHLFYSERLALLKEAVTLDQVPLKRGGRKVVMFVGRMQPPSIAHVKIIEDMKKKYPSAEPVIFIVKGEGTGLNKEKNPLDFNTQKRLLQTSTKNLTKNIYEIPSAFLGEMLKTLREQNMEPIAIFCGTDRVKSYQQQIDRYKLKLNLNIKVEEIHRTGEDVSASKIRDAIKQNDFETFSKMTVGYNKSIFDMLRSKIK